MMSDPRTSSIPATFDSVQYIRRWERINRDIEQQQQQQHTQYIHIDVLYWLAGCLCVYTRYVTQSVYARSQHQQGSDGSSLTYDVNLT